MSFEDGWAAINLEKPSRIPRTEYSAEMHWDLIAAVAGVHGFVLEPWSDMAAIIERYGQSHVIIGNADTRILLNGSKDQIRTEVERCIELGRDCPGFFMAVGNHIPPNTPVENALYYNDVYEELSWR